MHSARLLYNSDSYLAFERKKHITMCFRLLLLPPLSQSQFLFTNELSVSGIVMLCSDQKLLCDETKEYTVDILISHERVITLVF